MLIPNIFTAAAVLSTFAVGLPLGTNNGALVHPEGIETEVNGATVLDKRVIGTMPGGVATIKFPTWFPKFTKHHTKIEKRDADDNLANGLFNEDTGENVLDKRVIGTMPGGVATIKFPTWFPKFTKHHTKIEKRDANDNHANDLVNEDTAATLEKRIGPMGETTRLYKAGSIELTGKPIPLGAPGRPFPPKSPLPPKSPSPPPSPKVNPLAGSRRLGMAAFGISKSVSAASGRFGLSKLGLGKEPVAGASSRFNIGNFGFGKPKPQ